jgi:hypothetical protein
MESFSRPRSVPTGLLTIDQDLVAFALGRSAQFRMRLVLQSSHNNVKAQGFIHPNLEREHGNGADVWSCHRAAADRVVLIQLQTIRCSLS